MRLRLIAFFPLVGLVTFSLMASTSTFVSAVERRVLREPDQPTAHLASRYETECEALFQEIHALSHERTRCDAQPECAGSSLLCPAAMDAEVDRAFRQLRIALHERCDVPVSLMDYAWGGPIGETPVCGDSHDWLESMTSGKAKPTRFIF